MSEHELPPPTVWSNRLTILGKTVVRVLTFCTSITVLEIGLGLLTKLGIETNCILVCGADPNHYAIFTTACRPIGYCNVTCVKVAVRIETDHRPTI